VVQSSSDRPASGAGVRPSGPLTRIAIVNDVAGVAQLEVDGLRKAGWDADFYDLPKPGAKWPAWVKPIVLPLRLALSVPVILRLRRGRYDLVHVHFISQGFVGAASGRPYFLHAHGSDLHLNLTNPVMRAWSRAWIRRARGIFYVTPNLAAFVAEFGAKARLLPNPVDVARFAAIESPKQIGRILIFLRLAPVKGAQAIFDAVNQIHGRVSLAALDWGPLADEYKKRYGGRVEFLRPVAHNEVPALLAQFDAVIGQMEQGVPGLSELEAMAAGRVVIMRLDSSLFRDDPPPVVNVSRGSDIPGAIEQLQGDPGQGARLSESGRSWLQRHHGLEAHVRVLVDAYCAEPVGSDPAKR
jgi:glycosyltransferase involved in cell wall biosynthesis